jgi:hypothetical protein
VALLAAECVEEEGGRRKESVRRVRVLPLKRYTRGPVSHGSSYAPLTSGSERGSAHASAYVGSARINR